MAERNPLLLARDDRRMTLCGKALWGIIAKLQIQPESGGIYIRLVVVVVVVVGTLRLSRQEQTRLSPDQTRQDQTFLTPW